MKKKRVAPVQPQWCFHWHHVQREENAFFTRVVHRSSARWPTRAGDKMDEIRLELEEVSGFDDLHGDQELAANITYVQSLKTPGKSGSSQDHMAVEEGLVPGARAEWGPDRTSA